MPDPSPAPPAGTDATAPAPRGRGRAEPLDPRLQAWERRMGPVIICAALVPIVVAFTAHDSTDPFLFINIASWLIFVADLVVHVRWQPGYLRTGFGRFDTAIVILTFPWYLIPGLGNTAVLGLARLGRILRLVLASGSTAMLQRLVDRLGKAGLYAIVLIVVCSTVVYRVEPPSSGFTTFGDALWWGIVTFTTVGYGDLVPSTTEGRFMSVLLMFGGVALIGVLAGSLAELFTAPKKGKADEAADADGGDAVADAASEDADAPAPAAADDPVLAEVRALRAEISELRASLGGGPPTDRA